MRRGRQRRIVDFAGKPRRALRPLSPSYAQRPTSRRSRFATGRGSRSWRAC